MPLLPRVLVLLACVWSAGSCLADELRQGFEPAPPRQTTRSAALDALRPREPEPARIAHALAVEAIMRELARHLRGHVEEWGLAGLLHDIDLAQTRQDPSRHGIVGARLLVELGFGSAIAQAVAAHDDSTGVPRRTSMEHALYCADRSFWAIRSSGIGLEVGTAPATPAAVIKGLAGKGMTGRIDGRLEEAGAALGLTLDEVLSIALTAMRQMPSAPR